MIWESGISPQLRLHLLKEKSSSFKLVNKDVNKDLSK